MYFKNVFSKETSEKNVALDFRKQLDGFDTELLLFFASSSYDSKKLSREIKNNFPKSTVVGSSSYGELISGKMLKNSVVAVSFSKVALLDYKVEIVKDVKEKAEENIKTAFLHFEDHFQEKPSTMDFNEYVGIVLMDFASTSEERVIDKIGDLTNVVFVGGSSADNWEFSHTCLYYNGEVYRDTTILLLLKPAVKFNFLKTQSFKPTEKKFIATRVNLPNREILELNGKPVGDAYAEAVGTTIDQAEQKFSSNPIGVLAADDIFVRSPIYIDKNKMQFVCNIPKNMEVCLLQATDIIEDTKKALIEKEKEFGEITQIINFNCTLRTVEMENKGITGEYGDLFKDIPTVGFSTYGEAFLGHVNQTAVILVFGKE